MNELDDDAAESKKLEELKKAEAEREDGGIIAGSIGVLGSAVGSGASGLVSLFGMVGLGALFGTDSAVVSELTEAEKQIFRNATTEPTAGTLPFNAWKAPQDPDQGQKSPAVESPDASRRSLEAFEEKECESCAFRDSPSIKAPRTPASSYPQSQPNSPDVLDWRDALSPTK